MATVSNTNRYRNTGAVYARQTWNTLQERSSSTLGKLWAYLVAHPTLTQGVYYILIGLWPVLQANSFLAATGHKADVWLVQTVGLMLVVIGSTLCLAAYRREKSPEVVLLALASAAVLAGIHVWFVIEDHISVAYLVDAVLELGIIFMWFYGWYLVPATPPAGLVSAAAYGSLPSNGRQPTLTPPVATVPPMGQNGIPSNG